VPNEGPWVERRYKATAYLTPPQLKALGTLDVDEIKGMVVISTFPDDEIEVTWADLDGTVHTRTLTPEGELKTWQGTGD
jgi:hypothetical protein